MRRSRLLIVACSLGLCLVALALPAFALAGGSAGDQQYTDPFGGSNGGSTATATQTQTASAPPPAGTETAPPATAPAPAATAPAATSDPAPEPTATIAGPDPGTLPYTGYAAWAVAGFGIVMLGAGLSLRLRTR